MQITVRETLNGMGWPEMGYAHHLDKLKAFARGGVLLIDVATFLRDYENGLVYRPLRQELGPNYFIAGRFYPQTGWPDPHRSETVETMEPDEWAWEIVRRSRFNGHNLLLDPRFGLITRNEPDLACEGIPEAAGGPWGDYIPWSVYRTKIWGREYDTLREIERLEPNMRCSVLLGHLAGGHNAILLPGDVHPVSGEAVDRITLLPPDFEYQAPEFQQMLAWAKGRERVVDGLVHGQVFIAVHAYVHRDGSGWSEDTEGFWYALRPLRPRGYREKVQGKVPEDWTETYAGTPDPGGVFIQYPNTLGVVTEQNDWKCLLALNDPNVAREGANKLEAVLSYYQRHYGKQIKKVFYFIWKGGPQHAENVICGDVGGRLSYRVAEMLEWPEYVSEAPYEVGAGGGLVVDQIEAWLEDMWKRALGVPPVKAFDAFWKYALDVYKNPADGRAIIPMYCAARDGSYINYDHPRYVVGYTLPIPLWCEKGVWKVREGHPPLP